MTQQKLSENARLWLQALRTCELDELANGDDTMYEAEVELLEKSLEGAGLSLEDIGSSKDEVDELVKQKAKASAEFHLKLIRTTYNPQPENERCLRNDLRVAGLEPEDIGTSDEELQQLQHGRDVEEAGYYLDRLRDGDSSFKADLAVIIESNKVDPSEIESSAQEIAGLTS